MSDLVSDLYHKEACHLLLWSNVFQKEVETATEIEMTGLFTRGMLLYKECWKCKKRFIKEDGCNKMRCSCGAMMCYICKKPIQGYDHFEDKPKPTNPDKCPLWSNSLEIHAREVRQRAKELKKNQDPSIALKHDPTKDLPEVLGGSTDSGSSGSATSMSATSGR
ncbi:unnamed protein product, partial [Meganyctiphanes norvegica]